MVFDEFEGGKTQVADWRDPAAALFLQFAPPVAQGTLNVVPDGVLDPSGPRLLLAPAAEFLNGGF